MVKTYGKSSKANKTLFDIQNPVELTIFELPLPALAVTDKKNWITKKKIQADIRRGRSRSITPDQS